MKEERLRIKMGYVPKQHSEKEEAVKKEIIITPESTKQYDTKNNTKKK